MAITPVISPSLPLPAAGPATHPAVRPAAHPAAHLVAPVRVLVADPFALWRHGLCAMLAGAGGFEVVAQAATADEAVHLARRLTPHVVLLDETLAGGETGATVRQLAHGRVTSRVLVVGSRGGPSHLATFLAAGAAGVVFKEQPGDTLIRALRRLAPAGAAPAGTPGGALSPRERELLTLVGESLANREIAARLCISVKTVEAHKARMMVKLGLRNGRELLRAALTGERVGA